MNRNLLMLLAALTLLSRTAYSQLLNFNVQQMKQASDNIFVGTVNDIHFAGNEKNIPLTVISFNDVQIAKTSGDVTVQFLGGNFKGTTTQASHAPEFEPGKRYLVFAAGKDKKYANPISGNSGLMKVIKDDVTGVDYLLLHGHCVTGIADDKITISSKQLNTIKNGIPQYVDAIHAHEVFDLPVDQNGQMAGRIETPETNEAPMPLETFEQILAHRYELHFTQAANTSSSKPLFPDNREAQKTTGNISVCGVRFVPIAMEQVPSSLTPYYSLNNDCITNWNNVMNIYTTSPYDGDYDANNGQSELTGFPTSSDLNAKYGITWNSSAVGLTLYSWTGQCGTILESDVFVNPAFTYTDNPWDQVRGKAFVYKAVVTHELGHTWGLMDGVAESYDYGIPTVMQGLNYGIYENGIGVHATDAIDFRSNYNSQAPVPNTVDVGVESYYAEDGTGLKPATLNKYSVNANDVVTVSGMTVENISNVAVNNVTIQYFLSKDSLLDANDKMLETYNYPSMPPTSYNMTATYNITIPTGLSVGFYYLGAVIKYNTSTSDAITGNNVTFLPNMVRVFLSNNITSAENQSEIRIAKLPAKGSYALQIGADETGSAQLYNSLGQLLHTQSLDDKNIQLPDIDAIYMLVVHTQHGMQVFRLNNY